MAQSVPDLQAEADGGIEVTGAVSARLPFARDPFWFVYGGSSPSFDGIGFQTIVNGPGIGNQLPPGLGPSVALSLQARGDVLEGTLAVRSTQDEVAFYNTSVAGGPRPYVRDGGRLTIPTLTLTGPGGAQASAAGSATFPEIALPAGAATPIRTIPPPSDAGTYSLTFGDGGAFSEDFGDRGRTSGTWEVTAPGTVVVEIVNGGEVVRPGTVRYTYSVENGRLRLRAEFPPARGCDATCLDRHAMAILAEPQSLSSVQYAVESAFGAVR